MSFFYIILLAFAALVGAGLYGIKNRKERIDEISEDLNISDFFERKTGELSSGQKNRVSLAKSLINKPEILLLDEPTASLDPDIGDFVRSYIQNYRSKNKVTILLASCLLYTSPSPRDS